MAINEVNDDPNSTCLPVGAVPICMFIKTVRLPIVVRCTHPSNILVDILLRGLLLENHRPTLLVACK